MQCFTVFMIDNKYTNKVHTINTDERNERLSLSAVGLQLYLALTECCYYYVTKSETNKPCKARVKLPNKRVHILNVTP